MEASFITLKEVPINNNCPECFNSSGLKIIFKQKFVETKYYKSITDTITHDILCENCKTTIYPVRWTEEIERVVEYQTKALKPKAASTYLKKLTWIYAGAAVLLILGIIATIIYWKL
jgi:hypothetical protein